MTKILEIRDKLTFFCSKYEIYVFPVLRFVMAFLLFQMIGDNIGFMKMLSTFPVELVLALLCSILPVNFTLLFASVVVLLDMYSLAVEAAAVTLILFLLIYLLYFRFVPGEGTAAVLTPITFRLGIPYLMPIGCGLLRHAHSILSVAITTTIYYYLDGIRQNEAAFVATVTEEDTEVSSKFAMAISQITENQELFLVLGVFVITGLIVYLIRRSSVDYAWTIAIVAGSVIQISGLITGYLVMNISERTVGVLIGGIVSMVIAFLVQFFRMDLDYARTERVQFEDDDYFYYVKAIPKKMVASEEKTVKHFGTTASMGRRIQQKKTEETDEEQELSRKVLSKELDIDEELLK